MLRLLTCLDECGIQQKELVAATGWSKAQISISLNSGRLPANADKFRADVTRFVVNNDRIPGWLDAYGMTIADLFETVAQSDLPEPATGDINEHGEIAGHGPAWACTQYGHPGHDYQQCHVCHRQYEGHLQRARGRAVVMGASA